jgi:hypothetical protein
MMNREFRWDNDEYQIARAAGYCCMAYGDANAPDDGSNDGSSGGDSNGAGDYGGQGEFDGTPGSSPDTGTNENGGYGSYGPEGNPDVGDGPPSGYQPPEKKPDDSSNNDSGHGEEHGEEFENVADTKLSELLRSQWEGYKKRWGPVEEEMSDLLQDDDFGEDVVSKARAAGLAMDNAAQAQRQMDRYGMDLSATEKQAISSDMQRDRHALGAGLANKTRAGMVDLKDALQKDFIGIGNGIGATAVAGLGQAAQMETQRGAAIAQMKQQQSFFDQSQAMQQQQWQQQYAYAQKQQRSGIFGLIGTAIGSIWGPAGAMIGGSLGSLIG